jgi:hypothetical protein
VLHVLIEKMAKLPAFDKLTVSYLGSDYSVDQVKTMVGGSVNSADVDNTCVVRVSRALNGAGAPIPPRTGKFATRKGADKRFYGLRVREFWIYMLNKYGKPDVYADTQPMSKADFENKKGIMGFKLPKRPGRATGHFALWDGTKELHGDADDYFPIALEIGLWTN